MLRGTVPEPSPLTIYLDSNVLFSASYSRTSRFLQFWQLDRVAVATSRYAIDEVRKHIANPDHGLRFDELLAKMLLVSDADLKFIPSGIDLAAKDQPILAAAIAASMDYLITGDKNHFTSLYTSRIAGVIGHVSERVSRCE